MTKPTIYITNLETNTRYKVIQMNKETQTLALLDLETGEELVDKVSAFSGANFKVEKVIEAPVEQAQPVAAPEPMTEQEESYTPPKSNMPPYPFGTDQGESNSNSAPVDGSSKTELTESHSDAPTTQDVAKQATTVAQCTTDIPEVTCRKDALAVSNQFKEELRPIFERAKLIEQAVMKGHKGEAKQLSYVIKWLEAYIVS